MNATTRSTASTDAFARRLRRASLSLQGLTLIGAVAGVQGFASGAFQPLVDQLAERLPIEGPLLPAAALGLVVGGSQAAALVLGAKNQPRAPEAALVAGSVLVGWIAAQLPLVGWTAPVQWAFVVVGVVEVVIAALWRRVGQHAV
jgi:hypothetical protein